ncbi:MAG: signal peptidase I [Lachnospiraceae bacterium]|nr:signal peptidase I [Lachnospiraceae bacterium]
MEGEIEETPHQSPSETASPQGEADLPLEGARRPGDVGSAPTEAERRQVSAPQVLTDEVVPEASSRPTSEQLKAELGRERQRKRYNKTLRNTISILIVVAAAAVLIAVFFISVLRVRGDSMSPNLDEGDLVVAVKTTTFEPGDIIAFYYGHSILLKRVVGSAGDMINIDDEGNVYVNGIMLEEPYLGEKHKGEYTDIVYPYQVPEKRYFVLGDNRKDSIDSRSLEVGAIEADQVVGRVLFRIWPLGK